MKKRVILIILSIIQIIITPLYIMLLCLKMNQKMCRKNLGYWYRKYIFFFENRFKWKKKCTILQNFNCWIVIALLKIIYLKDNRNIWMMTDYLLKILTNITFQLNFFVPKRKIFLKRKIYVTIFLNAVLYIDFKSLHATTMLVYRVLKLLFLKINVWIIIII